MTNTEELEVAITRAGISKRKIAKLLGVSETTIYNKLNGKVEFKASEIVAMCDILRLTTAQRENIFLSN